MEQILSTVRTFDGVLVLAPRPGSAFPEVAWGDAFFYYSPDGEVPANEQPYATIVTKDYPDDTASRLDEEGRWRLNIHVDRQTFVRLTGEAPRALTRARDAAVVDVINPHPVYGPLGWVAIVNPGARTMRTAIELLRGAHRAARARFERRLNR
ncbi:DUF6194 family protein [Agromyces bauzanensis]